MGHKSNLVSLIAMQVPCEKLQKQIYFLSLTVVGTSQVLKRFLLSFETVHEYYSIFRFQLLLANIYCTVNLSEPMDSLNLLKRMMGPRIQKVFIRSFLFLFHLYWNNPGIRLISLV